jgi:hypothetical protein
MALVETIAELAAKIARYGRKPSRVRIHPSRCTPKLIAELRARGLEVFEDDAIGPDCLWVGDGDRS